VLPFELVLIRDFSKSFENQEIQDLSASRDVEDRLSRVFQCRVLGGCADIFVDAGTVILHAGNFVAAGDTYSSIFSSSLCGRAAVRSGLVKRFVCVTIFISSKPPSS